VLTPVAVLTPVDIGGVTVTHATLHNWNELARRQLRIGDTVQIERAGDVIPEVVGRVARRRGTGSAPQAPRRCPVCRSRVVVRGAFRLCPNTLGCAAQRARAIEHFASRDAFDIDGLGPGTVEALLRTGMVRNVADLFTLTDDDLRGLPRFGAVSANRLNAAIAAARRVGLARFLFALGIPSVGAATAAALAARFKTLEAVRHASARQLADARGVGPAAGREIAAFLRSPANQAIIGDLLRNGVTVLPFQHTGAAAHGGKTVVFTGRLETMTRSEAQRLVEDNGGRVAAAVSQATDLVVAGSAPGSKLARARALGIPVVSERQFLRRYAASRRPRPRRRTASSTSPASLS
jgi:DNA ligase (NAD+)